MFFYKRSFFFGAISGCPLLSCAYPATSIGVAAASTIVAATATPDCCMAVYFARIAARIRARPARKGHFFLFYEKKILQS
ncbi:MAG: hypothetical protein Q4F57_01300, partial [Weeksellaceae bacterium]|nr:hypothetical protein [Weeksellaceae bacterium]